MKSITAWATGSITSRQHGAQVPLTRSGCPDVSPHASPPHPEQGRLLPPLSVQRKGLPAPPHLPQLHTPAGGNALQCQSRDCVSRLLKTPQGPPGPPGKSLKGCSQKVRRQVIRCFPFVISSCRGGVFVKLKANFSPSHSKPNYCPQNSSRKQKDKIALSSYLAYRRPSDTCFICTSCPVPPSLSSPQGLQDQKTAGSKRAPNSFHFLFPELPKRSKKLGLHFCVCERVCTHVHRCPHVVHRGRA